MLFNSIAFLVFFAAVFLFYALSKPRWRPYVLLAASAYFYISWGVELLPLLALTILVSYIAALGISAGHLSRIFRQETGYTFVDYLMYVRVKRAAELLRDPSVKIYEVADLVGYSDVRYFGQVFRKVTGLTPREFREGSVHTGKPSAQE